MSTLKLFKTAAALGKGFVERHSMSTATKKAHQNVKGGIGFTLVFGVISYGVALSTLIGLAYADNQSQFKPKENHDVEQGYAVVGVASSPKKGY